MQSTFITLLDPPVTIPAESILREIDSYEKNEWTTNDLELIKKHGPLLFYKSNHQQYPLLTELARAIYTIQPTSTAIESVYSGTGRIVTSDRHSLAPQHVERLTQLKNNR